MFVVVVFVEQIKRIELLLLAFVHHCFEYSEQTEKKKHTARKMVSCKIYTENIILHRTSVKNGTNACFLQTNCDKVLLVYVSESVNGYNIF